MTARAGPRPRALAAPPAGRTRAEAGFTLVEMLVALAVFAIVSAVGLALAASALGATARAGTAFETVADLERMRRALASDLGQAAPRVSLGADGRPLPAFLLTPEGFVLVRRGVSGLLPSVQKVAWGFDGRRILRQTWPRVDGAEPGPPVVMLEGISAVRLRVAGDQGWQEGWQPDSPEALPRALELVLVRADGRALVLKFLVAA